MNDMEKFETFETVWDALEASPAEAAIKKLRADLMVELRRQIKERGLTQAQAAKLFGVTQPRISDLQRGKLGLFGLNSLISMAANAGQLIELGLVEPNTRAA
jgi:predicted XRE-type DNA-binding protein